MPMARLPPAAAPPACRSLSLTSSRLPSSDRPALVSYQSALTAAAQLAAMRLFLQRHAKCLPHSWSRYTPPASISLNHVAWILPGHVSRAVIASSTNYSTLCHCVPVPRVRFSAPARILSLEDKLAMVLLSTVANGAYHGSTFDSSLPMTNRPPASSHSQHVQLHHF